MRLAICALFFTVATFTLAGCGLAERLADQDAHLAALDKRVELQDRFLADLRTDFFLEIRKLTKQIGGLDQYTHQQIHTHGLVLNDLFRKVTDSRKDITELKKVLRDAFKDARDIWNKK